MTQRNIELLIGRLLTDEDFRGRYLANPERALLDQIESGLHLTPSEVSALTAIDHDLWLRVAGQIDPRLQKARLSLDE